MECEDEELPKIILPLISIDENQEYFTKILHIDSPGLFYLRIIEVEDFYSQFSENLEENYRKKSAIYNVDRLPLGSHWCVYTNEKFHRAKVVGNILPKKLNFSSQNEIYEELLHFEMVLVDLGVTRIVSIKDVYTLDEEFTLDAPMAVPCCLSLVHPKPSFEENPWSESECEEFVQFCLTSIYYQTYFVGKALNSLFEVVLESTKGIVINEMMIKDNELSTKLDKIVENGAISLCPVNGASALQEDEAFKNFNPMEEDYKRGTMVDTECASTMFIGYKNDDDAVICKFYKRGKACLNGETCRFKHIQPRNDGLPSGHVFIYSDTETDFVLPEEGTVQAVVVTCVRSPSFFFVRFIRNNEIELNFNDLLEDMKVFYKHSRPKVGLGTLMPSLGQLMVANNPKSTLGLEGWHRVRILQLKEITPEELSVQVSYIDCGFEEWVEEKYLRDIERKFVQLPAQAIECWLYGLKSPEDGWKEQATHHMCNFIKNKTLIAEVMAVDDITERLGLVIYEEKSLVVLNDQFHDKGLALLEEENQGGPEDYESLEDEEDSYTYSEEFPPMS